MRAAFFLNDVLIASASPRAVFGTHESVLGEDDVTRTGSPVDPTSVLKLHVSRWT